MRFPTRERENGLCRGFLFEKAVFPFLRGKNCISQGVKNRGSLISVPLALREDFGKSISGATRAILQGTKTVPPFSSGGQGRGLPKAPFFGPRIFVPISVCVTECHEKSPAHTERLTLIRQAPDTLKFFKTRCESNLSVRPKCSHRCVSLKESPLKPVIVLKDATTISAEQTSIRTKWFKHIAF